MGRIEKAIKKYGLRDSCSVSGIEGQKMEEDCIQRFVKGDPSGTGKYLDWMLFQAGGGQEQMDRSLRQWQIGEGAERPVSESLRNYFLARIKLPPEEALAKWESEYKDEFRKNFIYGDEDYTLTGFGFYRKWSANDRYADIVATIKMFHKHIHSLKDKHVRTDLTPENYPTLESLKEVLCEAAMKEVLEDIRYDTVYDDAYLNVVCPLNIGASVKFGHPKWCTSNVSMFEAAYTGDAANRWKEYASHSGLFYCLFKPSPNAAMTIAMKNRDITKFAVQVPLCDLSTFEWTLYNSEDKSLIINDFSVNLGLLAREHDGTCYCDSFGVAIEKIKSYMRKFDIDRVSTDF